MPSTKPEPQLELIARRHSDVVVVNGRCEVHEEEDVCIVVVSGVPVFRYHRDDRVERALFVAQALASGYATARELASALGMGERTVYEIQARYRQGGAKALIPKHTFMIGNLFLQKYFPYFNMNKDTVSFQREKKQATDDQFV